METRKSKVMYRKWIEDDLRHASAAVKEGSGVHEVAPIQNDLIITLKKCDTGKAVSSVVHICHTVG
jgi:hypothetical protein